MANDPNPEVIRQQMAETRADLTEKLETLEGELADTVQNATGKVTETTESVRETVAETAETVRGSVHDTLASIKSTFDINRQVDQHPWLMFAGAVAAGYVGGCLASSLETPAPFEPVLTTAEAEAGHWSAVPSEASWLSETAEKFKPEIDQMKSLALGAAISVARDLLGRYLPPEFKNHVSDAVDGFTVKLGGKPIHGLVPEDRVSREKAMAAG
jgi:ElaB/YqjD/DUF883 family membrane-anchored ribosome-binding protein